MVLLGISGPIGHGKSSLLAALRHAEPLSQSNESSLLISDVANHLNISLRGVRSLPNSRDIPSAGNWLDHTLPSALKAITSVEFQETDLAIKPSRVAEFPERFEKLWLYLDLVCAEPSLLESQIIPDNKSAYRPLLQWLGGYVTAQLGYSLWYKELVLRAMQAKQEGCKLYIIGGVRFPEDAEVIRHADGRIVGIIRPALEAPDNADITEHSSSQIVVDTRVVNNGSLLQLEALAHTLFADLQSDSLQASYQTQAL